MKSLLGDKRTIEIFREHRKRVYIKVSHKTPNTHEPTKVLNICLKTCLHSVENDLVRCSPKESFVSFLESCNCVKTMRLSSVIFTTLKFKVPGYEMDLLQYLIVSYASQIDEFLKKSRYGDHKDNISRLLHQFFFRCFVDTTN